MGLADNERRRESRALTAALIEIIDEFDDVSACVLEDLSPSGARVHSDIALRIGMNITVKVGPVAHGGVVRHCAPSGEGYSIGIYFVEGQWPTPIQLPVHWIGVKRD